MPTCRLSGKDGDLIAAVEEECFRRIKHWGGFPSESIRYCLKEAGLKLDRRQEFPQKAASLSVAPEREVPAFALGPMRRGLAEAMEAPRTVVWSCF
jgi:hypothetical protein